VQAGEECDDGNTVEDDACDNACSANVCGNGDLEPGEDCDDGNLVAGDGCDVSCNLEVVDTCGPCRTAACTNYMGALNVVAGCLDAGATGDTARAVVGASFSMAQVQACVDVVDCAFANDCAYNPANRVSPCYCGTLSVDDCNNAANAVNGACQAEVEAAVGSTTRSTIMLGMSDLNLPMGWAYFLLECDGSFCDDSALGDCTPN
jgi:cysteine-rich repeat protein